jgi:hypothetical protein
VISPLIGSKVPSSPGGARRYEAVVTPIARRCRASAVRAHAVFLGASRLRAQLRDLLLPLVPERLFDRGLRRFIDAERPLPDFPAAVEPHLSAG